MANNPLYPGYKPKKEGENPINPTYPGYYVGGPMSKRPTPKNFLKPNEYKFDELINQIDGVAEDLYNTPIISPKWYVDRVVDDWKNQLKVSVSPEGVKIDSTELDDYATDDLAGATTELSLNPTDWGIGNRKGTEQTKAQIKKTLTGWVKEATGVNLNNLLDSNFSEIQNKTNLDLWNIALGYREDIAEELEKRAGEAITERTTEAFKDVQNSAYTDSSGKKLSPLDLKHKIDENGQLLADGRYDKVANAVSNFERAVDNRRDRDKLHTTFLTETFDAVKEDLNKDFKATTPNQKIAIDFFDKKVETLKTVEGYQEEMGKLVKKLNREAFITKDVWRDGTDKKTQIKDLLSEAIKTEEGDEGFIKKSLDTLEKLKKDVKEIGAPQGQIDFIKNQIEKYESHIKQTQSVINNAINNDSVDMRNLVRVIGGPTPEKNFTTRSTFQNSLAGGLRKDIERSFLSRDEFSIGSIINDPSLNLRAQKIAPLIQRLRQDRIQYAAKEVLDSFDRNGIAGIAENYVWKEIKNRLPANLERLSSGGIISDTLKKTNYFGLKIDDYGTPSDAYFLKNPLKQAAFEKRYVNKAVVELGEEFSGLFSAGFSNKIVVTGSDVSEDRFKFLHKKFQENSARGLPSVAPASIAIIGDKVLEKFDLNKNLEDQILFARLINNDRSDDALEKLSQKMFGKGLNGLTDEDKKAMGTFITKIDYSNNWVYQKSGGKLKALEMQKGRFSETLGFANTDAEFFKAIGMSDKEIESILGTSGIKNLKISKGDFGIFKNSQVGLLTQKAVDQKEADKIFFNLFKQKGDFKVGEHSDISINKLYKTITGKDFKSLNLEEQIKWTKDLAEMKWQANAFSEWVLKQRNIFGDKVDDPAFRLKLYMQFKNKGFSAVKVDQNDKSFLLIKNIFNKNESLNRGYKLTQKRYLGRLEKINDKMQSLQKAFNKTFFGKTVKYLTTWQKILAERFAKKMIALFSKLFAKITGTAITALTGGLAVLLPILQAVLEKIAQVVIKRVVAVFKGLFKLDFSEFNKLLEQDLKKLYQLLACSCGCIASLFIPFLFIIVIFTSILNPTDPQRKNREGYGQAPTSGEPDPRVFGCGGGGKLCGTGDCSRTYGGCGDGGGDEGPGLAGFYYSQCNPSWGNEPMIITPKGPLTLCMAGCYASSFAMVYNHFGYPYTPLGVYRNEDQMGRYIPGNADAQHANMKDISMEYLGNNQEDWRNFFDTHSDGIMIVNIQDGSCYGVDDDGNFTQHFVVVSGYKEEDFILYDPYKGPDACLKQEYSDANFPRAWGYYQEGGMCVPGGGAGCGCDEIIPNNDLCDSKPRTGNTAADRALDIVCDLREGVDCDYNRPGENMPQEYSTADNNFLWNEEKIIADGCTYKPTHTDDIYIYFWCTWLVKKAYGELGSAGMVLGAKYMCEDLNRVDNNIDNVKVGDVACFYARGEDYVGHVGIVWSVDKTMGTIVVLESNSGATKNTYVAMDDGRISPSRVVYFGRR